MGKDIRFRLLSSEGKHDLSQTPEAKDFVRISFRGYVKNKEANQLFTETDNLIIVLSESDVPPGLEMGVRFCPIGCSAEVTCTSKFAYGDRGRKKQKDKNYIAVPPSAELLYSFIVHEVIDYVDDLQQVQIKKSIGNESFQYDLDDGYKALLVWKKTINMVDSFVNVSNDDISEEKLKSFEEIKIDLYNNIALVYYNQKQYNECKASCNTILDDLDDKNSKACIRLGYALLELGAEFPEIHKVIQRAANMSPGGMENIHVRKLFSLYKKKKNEYIEKRKEVSKKMMKPYNTLSNEKNDEQEVKVEDMAMNQKKGYSFIRNFGSIEFLFLVMIALTANELYYNPEKLEDLKQRFHDFLNRVYSMMKQQKQD